MSESGGGNSKEGEPKNPMATIQNDLMEGNELMSRLQAFMPKIQAANAALPTENAAAIDVDLEAESGSSSDEESETDSSSGDEGNGSPPSPKLKSRTKKNTSNSKIQGCGDENDCSDIENMTNDKTQPTIQIQFAMGNMEGNPMMKLLNNEDDGDDNYDDSDSDGEEQGKKRAIKKLLEESKTNGEAKEALPKKKKPLIQEL